MDINHVTHPGMLINQPEPSSAGISKCGLVDKFRHLFYGYDLKNGTTTNYGATMMGIGAGAAVGAFTLGKLADKITTTGAVRPDTALSDRAIDRVIDRAFGTVETIVKENPLACGAAAGAATAILGIYMLGSSLKPVAVKSIEAARDELRHQLKINVEGIKIHEEQIAQYQKRLSEFKPQLPAEVAKYQEISQQRYEKELTDYQQKFDRKVGRLTGYMDAVLKWHLSNSGDAPREQNGVELFRAGSELTSFINSADQKDQLNLVLSKWRLLDALKPLLSDKEYRTVSSIVWSFPVRPSFYVEKGPIAKQYSKTLKQSESEQREISILESRIKEVLIQYPNLKPDAAGNIPKPPAQDFRHYMPE
ncbi:hypothetical protein [Endozoicomonas sp. ONNA2]|uniref:hypothetical protein n=1 Tax=Endozoicomonas sp. ONNA2 TaxID=2828741 RepID=UPI0021474823|nr:hypothetical protein [Endozoicomonas sp. ONNA2]